MAAKTMRRPFAHGDPAGPLRHDARAVLLPLYLDIEVDDVLIVISELVQNVTQHTTGGGVLVLNWDDDCIIVEVRDYDQCPPHPLPTDGVRLGGRGLLLVAGICSHWGATPEERGKTVWARIAVAAAEDTHADR